MKNRTIRTPRRRRRLPNGFGQISEIKGQNLRKPFRVMVSVGKDEFGKPICKLLKPEAYFETYNDAYLALVKYNHNPYDMDPTTTMLELYHKWSVKRFEKIKDQRVRAMETAWKFGHGIYDMRVSEVRTRHLKGCLEHGYITVEGQKVYPSDITKSNLKTIFNQMFDYAVEYELADRNYARQFKLEVDAGNMAPKNPHIAFTDNEMRVLWDNVYSIPYVDVILIQCYSGWRPNELCDIKIEDVDVEQWSFSGGMKTKAGYNRLVPIHSRIRDLVNKRYVEQKERGQKYLFACHDGYNSLSGNRLNYEKYQLRFEKIIEALDLNPNHRLHDCRVQFVTSAKKANVDEYVIKLLVGHAIEDITEKTYTRRDLEWLRSEIEKIS